MRESSGGNFGSKISVESMRSRNSGSVSLGRPSWDRRDHSLSKKASLVYVMSIESDHKSDMLDRMLEENSYTANHAILWNRSSMENNNRNYNTHHRMSLEQSRPIKHSCDCYADCLAQQCACYQARYEICQSGTCCQTCIQMKNAILMADRGDYCSCKNTQCLKSYCKCFQNNGACTSLCRCQDCHNKIDSKQRSQAMQALKTNQASIVESERRYCTCKKTKCNKKYCSCYANGVKCTNLCQCEGCHNCDRDQNAMDEQEPPEFIEQEDLSEKPFPQRMSFQEVQFTKHY